MSEQLFIIEIRTKKIMDGPEGQETVTGCAGDIRGIPIEEALELAFAETNPYFLDREGNARSSRGVAVNIKDFKI